MEEEEFREDGGEEENEVVDETVDHQFKKMNKEVCISLSGDFWNIY